jgi:dihydropteroate synthase
MPVIELIDLINPEFHVTLFTEFKLDEGHHRIIDDPDEFWFDPFTDLLGAFLLDAADAAGFDKDLVSQGGRPEDAPGRAVVLHLYDECLFALRNGVGELFGRLIHHFINFAGCYNSIPMVESRGKGKAFSGIRAFEFNGKKMDFSAPRVMGIVNVTPDSFFAGCRLFRDGKTVRREDGKTVRREDGKTVRREDGKTVRREDGKTGGREEERWRGEVEEMVKDGAYIIDIGAVSTRPGAMEVKGEEEKRRLLPVLKAIRADYPDLIISIDTYRSEIARIAVSEGADIINDISGGLFDPAMIPFIAGSGVPFIMMHIQGTPANMQVDPKYGDVVAEVYSFLEKQCQSLAQLGHQKIIVDPGFGFGKTVQHNFQLLKNLERFNDLGFPILAGLSRKSMINKVLGTKPEDALNGTTVLNTIALLNGASILRVHDVKEAVEAVKLVRQ